MYAITMQLYASTGSAITTKVYESLAEVYHLPSIATLLTSIEIDVSWDSVDKDTQVYFIDNLREANRRNVFQLRFKANVEAHEHVALFLSINEQEQVHNMTLQFPSRGDRRCSSHIIGWLKDIALKSGATIDFEIAGYGERDSLRYIREHSLSAFQYHPELKRYLHVTDKPLEVKETKKGMNRQ